MNKVLSSIEVCRITAQNLKRNIANLSEAAIELLLRDFWHTAQSEGYEKKKREVSSLKETSKAKLEVSWKEIETEIDDKTHGGITNKKING